MNWKHSCESTPLEKTLGKVSEKNELKGDVLYWVVLIESMYQKRMNWKATLGNGFAAVRLVSEKNELKVEYCYVFAVIYQCVSEKNELKEYEEILTVFYAYTRYQKRMNWKLLLPQVWNSGEIVSEKNELKDFLLGSYSHPNAEKYQKRMNWKQDSPGDTGGHKEVSEKNELKVNQFSAVRTVIGNSLRIRKEWIESELFECRDLYLAVFVSEKNELKARVTNVTIK